VVAAVARVVLAVTFAISGAAKVRSRRALPAAMRAFGVPARAAGVAAIVVPAVELALAVALLVAWTSRWPVWVAIVVLVAFTALLVRAAVRHVPCPCFGVVDDAPVGPVAVVRNGAFLAIAVLALGPR
jgi:uncharacterized membrane protein YphA (DoxX/SURF4 family)